MDVNRRDFLGTGTAVAFGTLAGCSQFRRSLTGHRLAHEVTVINDTYPDLDLSLTVTDGSGTTILTERFQLANGRSHSLRPFVGKPAKIRLQADEIGTRTVDWPRPRNECTDSTRTTAIVSFEQSKLYVQGGCETITTE